MSNGTKIKDNYIDDNNTHKTSRTKTNGKKSNDLEQTNILPITNSGKIPNLEDFTSHRGKTVSDSSVSAVQYLLPSPTIPQTEPSRQRSSVEYISSLPTTTGNVHHKKARK
jgi:hypothetical protein